MPNEDQDDMSALLDDLDDETPSDESPSGDAPDESPSEPSESKKKASKKAAKKSTPPPAPDEPEGEASYVVAPGKCVACGRRGYLTEGASISADDFSDGEEGLQGLVDAGYVVAN